jgi:transcriptional regulator with XRE-family HTH domain
MSSAVKPIHNRELLAYQADVKGSIFRQIRERFSRLKSRGFTQKEWSARINMDAGQLSRRIRGDYDLQLETLSDLARGLECRISVKLEPLTAAIIVPDYVPPESAKPNIECLDGDKKEAPKTSPLDERTGSEVSV